MLKVVDWNKFLEGQHKSESIICPYCNYTQSQDTVYEHITYYGYPDITDPNKKICECESCCKKFRVIEIVTREYETERINEQD